MEGPTINMDGERRIFLIINAKNSLLQRNAAPPTTLGHLLLRLKVGRPIVKR